MALFGEQVTWLAPHLPDPSLLGFCQWIANWLSSAERQRLRGIFPLDHETQRRGEEAVIVLLGGDHRRRVQAWRVMESAERSVDWARTYVESMGRVPHQFWVRAEEMAPHLSLYGSLVGLASQWAGLLELYGNESDSSHQIRARALRSAIHNACKRSMPKAIYSLQHERQIQRMGPDEAILANNIREALSFWGRRLDHPNEWDLRFLRKLSERLGTSEAENVNHLLELTTRLCIARAAGSAKFDGQPWQMEKVDFGRSAARRLGGTAEKPRLRLHAGSFHCEISKGSPSLPNKKSGASQQHLKDSLVHRQEAMGLRAEGRQPDIVLAFWFETIPHDVVFALADAKRNATGTGDGYLKTAFEDMTVYQVAFSRALRLSLARDSLDFAGPINPSITIFALQGVVKVGGIPSTNQEAIINRLLQDEPLPSIMALDMVQYGIHEGEWRAPVVSAWFERLANQAARELKVSWRPSAT